MSELVDRKPAFVSAAWAILLAVLVFVSVAPTLTLLEFSGGSENLNAATVQEIHWGGPWIVPMLNGRPRLAKPPLTAWISAAYVGAEDIARLNSPDQASRDAAFNTFAFKLRWPALLAGCGLVLAVYWLGRSLHSPSLGMTSAIVCASTLMFMRFIRNSTTDVQLALWVGVANAVFASLVFTKVRVWKLVLLGVAMGLALMSKGPVALVQTVVPWIVFGLLDVNSRQSLFRRPGIIFLTTVCVTAVMLTIAVPWPIYVLAKYPSALELWRVEVTREGATTLAPDPWYSYITGLLLVMPWIGFFIAGIAMAVRDRTNRAAIYSISLLIVPIVLMSMAKDKNDRYLLPMLPAAAILISIALKAQFLPHDNQNAMDRFLRRLHFGILGLIIVGLPICGASGVMKTVDQLPWYSWTFAVSMLLPLAALLIVFIRVNQKRPGILIPATLVVMLVMQGVFIYGYAHDNSGRSEMKAIADVIMNHSPKARVWYYDPRTEHKAMPQDLSIYLNRAILDARDEATLQKAAAGDVMVMLQREKETSPAITGWRPLGARPWGKRFWWSFERVDQ